jgi:hypothetical protein
MERDNLWYYDYDLFGIRIFATLYLYYTEMNN